MFILIPFTLMLCKSLIFDLIDNKFGTLIHLFYTLKNLYKFLIKSFMLRLYFCIKCLHGCKKPVWYWHIVMACLTDFSFAVYILHTKIIYCLELWIDSTWGSLVMAFSIFRASVPVKYSCAWVASLSVAVSSLASRLTTVSLNNITL